MKFEEVIDKELRKTLTNKRVIGVDIGSRTGKAILLADGEIFTARTYTGLNMKETAEELFTELLAKSNLQRSDISYIVATGYGRIAIDFDPIPCHTVTEISCHAMGIHYLNSQVKTIIDIGGQDSKAIRVDPATGKVDEFVINDKCAAGTGRFLERVAELLEVKIDDLGEISVQADKPSEISSQCVVFAESEIISHKAKGERPANIAAGIHLAAARRICNQLSRIGLEPELAFSGGVSNNIGMKKVLEEVLKSPILSLKMDCIYAGALGAAIYAQQSQVSASISSAPKEKADLDLTALADLITNHQDKIISGSDKKKHVGYLCTYTPLELLNAAGTSYLRLFKQGNTAVVSSGEQMTQSFFCDFIKSILGAFKEGEPLYKSLDKVYTFYTCDCIKMVGEAIGNFFAPSAIFLLPRLSQHEPSRSYYKQQILDFKQDLEKLTGREIDEEEVKKQIRLYNQVRNLLKKISELRKRKSPPLTGQEYLELLKGYYYLPPELLLELYQAVYEKLSVVPDEGPKKIRLMMAGGIIADGDRRLLEIVEREIGARIVVEDHCTGFRSIDFSIDETGDPYKALADGYISKSPCARMKPLRERIDLSGELAEEYDVDGILYVYLKFCPCYGQTKHEYFKHFQKSGIPIMEISLDYSKSDEGQLKTRLEAFVEVLAEREEKLSGSSRY